MPCSWWTQYTLLTRRHVWAATRDPSESATRIIIGCWLGMFAGETPSLACDQALAHGSVVTRAAAAGALVSR